MTRSRGKGLRTTRALTTARLFLLVLLISTLSACGGGEGAGKDSESAGSATQPSDVADNERQLALDNAYDNGGDTCSQYSRKDLAGIYGVPNKPEQIAKAVAAREADAELRKRAREGCLAALGK